MKVADTSALYALIDADDTHHQAAAAAIAAEYGVIVPAEIWSETLCLVQFRMGHAAARAAADYLRNHPQIEIQPTPADVWEDLAGKAETLHGDHVKLSFADAVVAAWCQGRGLQPLAFDQNLIAACG